MRANFIYYLLPNLVRGMVGMLVMIPLTTHFLDPHDFGVVATITMVSGLLPPLASSGSAWVFAGHLPRAEESERGIILVQVLLWQLGLVLLAGGLGTGLGLWLLPHVVTDWQPLYQQYFVVAVIGQLLGTFWPVFSTYLILAQRGRLHAVLELLQYGAMVGMMFAALAWWHWGLWALFITPVVANLVGPSVALLALRRSLGFRNPWKWGQVIFRQGLPSILPNLSEIAAMSADQYYLQRWFPLADLGIYSHSQSYKNLFNYALKAFSSSFMPLILAQYAGTDPERRASQWLRQWYLVLGGLGLGATCLSYEVVALLTHGKFNRAAVLITPWFLQIVVASFGIAYLQYLFHLRETRVLVLRSVIMSGVSIVLNGVLIYFYGLLGAVAGPILVALAGNLWFRHQACQRGCQPVGDREALMAALPSAALWLWWTLVAVPPLWFRLAVLAVGGSLLLSRLWRLRTGSQLWRTASP
jgi:O-antigen/teichoic acid export membrane protein